jgi:hypothetical protein
MVTSVDQSEQSVATSHGWLDSKCTHVCICVLSHWVHAAIGEGPNLPAFKCSSHWNLGLYLASFTCTHVPVGRSNVVLTLVPERELCVGRTHREWSKHAVVPTRQRPRRAGHKWQQLKQHGNMSACGCVSGLEHKSFVPRALHSLHCTACACARTCARCASVPAHVLSFLEFFYTANQSAVTDYFHIKQTECARWSLLSSQSRLLRSASGSRKQNISPRRSPRTSIRKGAMHRPRRKHKCKRKHRHRHKHTQRRS